MVLVFLGGPGSVSALQIPHYDWVIKNGLIVDGTGLPPYKGDVALAGGKIVKVGKLGVYHADRIVDATGLVVAPGFIDLLRHEDLLWNYNEQKRAIEQGITSGLVGNCGFSILDVNRDMKIVQQHGVLLNVGTLIGQGTLRNWFVKTHRRQPATPEEMKEMKAFVEKSLEAGAFGLSSGLGYRPGEWCEPPELQDLASVLSRYPHAVYYSHIRNFRSDVLSAIQEAIDVGEVDKVPVVIQHLMFKMPSNWNLLEDGLLLVEQARERGVKVYATVYPYDFWGNEVQLPLSQFLYLPPDSIDWGYYHDSAKLNKVLDEIHLRLEQYGGGSEIEITQVRSKAFKSFLGWTIKDLAKQRHMSEASVVLALLLENGDGVKICYHGLSQEGLIKKIQDPYILFGTDSTGNIPHPRDVGAFPRLLGLYVRDERVIRLSDAIHRLTQEPAQLLGLKDRGLIRTGDWGDVVVFDYNTIGDAATAISPWIPPHGFRLVLVNGQRVWDTHGFSKGFYGKVLRRTDD